MGVAKATPILAIGGGRPTPKGHEGGLATLKLALATLLAKMGVADHLHVVQRGGSVIPTIFFFLPKKSPQNEIYIYIYIYMASILIVSRVADIEIR
jgi:hypothetical protein